jgi:glycosyltransferase involved in cell wall biosynthesis
MRLLAVHHFGPDPTTVGGMATAVRILSEHGIGADAVEAHPTWTPNSRLATLRSLAICVRTVLRMPAGQLVHVHLSERGSFLREGALVALARKRGLTTVVTIHGASFIPFAQRRPKLVAAVLGRAHLVTCLEQGAADVIRRSSPGVRCEILPNAVAVDDTVFGSEETDELVVFAGEIGLRKGADVLCRAWPTVAARRPAARCLMVGPLADFVPGPAERLEVRPPVGPSEMKEILRSARVVALPARAEAMPMVLTEAMSLGRPFVSTRVGGIPELAAGGLLVAVDDELELADRLTRLLADPELARTIGEQGRRFCVETRSLEVIDRRLRELYEDACSLSR